MAPRALLLSRRGLPWLGVALWSLGLAILAAAWWYVFNSLEADRRHTVAAAEARIAGLNQAVAEQVRGTLREYDQLASFLVHDFEEHGARVDLPLLRRKGLFDHRGVVAVFFADARGEVFASTQPLPGANVAQEDFFQVHGRSAGQSLYVGRAQAAAGGQWVMHVTRRLSARDGSFAGIAAVVTDPAYLTGYYSEARFGRRGLVSLVGLDGVVRARRSGNQLWFGEAVTDRPAPPQEAQGPHGFALRSQLDGVDRLLHSQLLGDYALAVVSGLAEDEVLAPYAALREQRIVLFLSASALLLAAFAGVGVLTHRLRLSEERFVAAADAQLDALLILRAVRNAKGGIVDFRCEHCNQRAAELFGVSRRMLMERSRRELLGDAANEQHFEMYCRVVETRRPEQVTFQLRRPLTDGLWLHYQVTPFGDGFVLTARDVTAERRREQALQDAQLAQRESEQRLRMVADHIPGYVVYVDAGQRITYANRGYEATALVSAVIGKTVREARGEELYEHLRPHVEAALAGEAQRFTVREVRGAEVSYLQYHYVPDLADDGRVRGFYALGYDVTEASRARMQVERQERRLRGITDNLPVLIAHLDAEERLEFVNETARDWLGLVPEQIIGRRIAEVWGPQIDAERRPYLERAYRGERVEFQAERAVPEGATRFLLNSYIPEIGPDGKVRGLYMISTDVSALKAVEQQLSTLARFDALTGLANRHLFNERLPEALARAQRTGQALALMYLDIDHFKAINDNYGHATGDGVLREFAQRLKNSVRATDTVARLAGDEFVVILENLHSEAEPQFVARKIVAQVNRPFIVGPLELAVSTSVGIALHRSGGSAEELLARADKALYAAKSAGRNTFHVAASS